MEEMGACVILATDNEFKPYEEEIKSLGVKEMWFSDPYDKKKNVIVERVHGTIALRLQKWRIDTGKNNWTDELGKMVSAYNNSYHKTIKAKPIDIWEGRDDSRAVVRKKNMGTYAIGDVVRKRLERGIFYKGDMIRYSTERFTIVGKSATRYLLDDGSKLRGEDISRAEDEESGKAERIIERVESNKNDRKVNKAVRDQGLGQIWQGRETITIPSRLGKRVRKATVKYEGG